MTLKNSFSVATLSGIILSLGSMPAMAAFGFTGVYAPSNFTFSSSPSGAGDETNDLDTTNAASGKVILYGPDEALNGLTGNPQAAYSQWTIGINSSRAGTVSFGWKYYNQFDPTIGNDSGGYVLNGTFVSIVSNDGNLNNTQSSAAPVILNLSQGDSFGFRVSSLTNTGGEGVFTVTDFDFTPQSVPEPLTIFGTGVVLGALPILKKEYAKRNKKKDKDT